LHKAFNFVHLRLYYKIMQTTSTSYRKS
jgi:hypothetical protein